MIVRSVFILKEGKNKNISIELTIITRILKNQKQPRGSFILKSSPILKPIALKSSLKENFIIYPFSDSKVSDCNKFSQYLQILLSNHNTKVLQ